MEKNLQDLEEKISQIKKRYIDALPERLKNLEDNIVDLETPEKFEECLKYIIHEAHSLKGAAAMYGMPLMSVMAHHFETILEKFHDSSTHLQDLIDNLLEYNDLMYQYAVEFSAQGQICDKTYKSKFNDLINKYSSPSSSRINKVIIVEPTTIIARQMKDYFVHRGCDVTYFKDSLEALGHLTTIKYDVLITSGQNPHIDGQSLINALRVIDGPNTDILTILVSSSSSIKNVIYEPSAFIEKNIKTIENLDKIIHQFESELT